MWIIKTKDGKYVKSVMTWELTDDISLAVKFPVRVSERSLSEDMICEEVEDGAI